MWYILSCLYFLTPRSMFKKILIALSILLNVCLLVLALWGDLGAGMVDKLNLIVNGVDVNDEFELKEGQSFEDQFGVSGWILENTANSLIYCSNDFRCMSAMQFIYIRGINNSLMDYQGDVYACKSSLLSPFTFLTPEKAEDPFQCVKMTKKYRGLGTDAIQSDLEGLEGIEKVKFE